LADSVEWEGDVLGRRDVANFLDGVISAKVAAQQVNGQEGALCIAIDGDWGVGKTFFVDRWTKELSGKQFPVVRFDAWKNDLADDPLIGFISELKHTLEPWIARLPVSAKIRGGLTRRAKTVIKQAARATLPLAASAGTAFAMRHLGEQGVGALKDAFGDVEVPEADVVKTAAQFKISDKVLQAFFDSALKKHQGRQAAITNLVEQLESLVEFMKGEPIIQLPLFIFIDELDRCRPDYAIRLLEGMKHLFNAKGVCFVVTTNLLQLSEAIKAVYGNNFDGYGYLKRFFDFEYQLPDPEGMAYARYLIRTSTLNHRLLDTGIRVKAGRWDSKAVALDVCFYRVAQLFSLTLRSQRQVLLQTEAAASALPMNHKIHIFYLFCLAATAHKRPDVISLLNSNKSPNVGPFLDGLPNLSIEYSGRRSNGDYHEGEMTLKTLFNMYQGWSVKTKTELAQGGARAEDYPSGLLFELVREPEDARGHSPLSAYSRCVRLAGQMFKPIAD